MAVDNQHSRILLAKNMAGSVAFCEECDVVEIEVGAVSLRIEATSLEAVSILLKEAESRLNYYNSEKAAILYQQSSDLSMH